MKKTVLIMAAALIAVACSGKPAAPAAFTAEQHLAAMNRRHFLRGLGACIALPSLASLD